jgi:hypothetical protein
VLDPEDTMVVLDSGLKIYQQYYLRKWRRSLERKAEFFPADYAFGKLSRFRSLREMTSFFVTNYTAFPDLASYLRGYAITGDRLAGLAVPSSMLLARPMTLSVHRTRWGGHCGFLADYRLRTWSDDYLVREFSPTP